MRWFARAVGGFGMGVLMCIGILLGIAFFAGLPLYSGIRFADTKTWFWIPLAFLPFVVLFFVGRWVKRGGLS
ncbi:MAG TPA: hypothetical protein PKA27_17030 [Fimbriimonadaceae bacterium]|nr:hypothetical protein [Fimbriimonadaceae bacterium]